MAVTESRRERLRRELTDQIVTTALGQLDEGGIGAVSWRGIAKEIGMNPASLYTYVDGMNDLFTRMLVVNFNDLAQTIASAAGDPALGTPQERLRAASHAYRSWALAYPRRFNLIFTDQIPGYEAPPEGPTVAAEIAVFAPFMAALAEITGGPADPVAVVDLHPERQLQIMELLAGLHGFVMLEVNNHAPFLEDGAAVIDHLSSRLDTLR